LPNINTPFWAKIRLLLLKLLFNLELLLELQHYGAATGTNTPFWAKIRLLLLKLLSINCNLSHSEKILLSSFGWVNLSISPLFKTKTPPSLSLLESQANHKATKKSRLKSTSPVAAP
jgi:peptidoglycan biosynthesis protein MviN/MurJ (putative lipid II flippase)